MSSGDVIQTHAGYILQGNEVFVLELLDRVCKSPQSTAAAAASCEVGLSQFAEIPAMHPRPWARQWSGHTDSLDADAGL